MVMAQRFLFVIERVLIVLLSIGLLFLVFDLFQAWNASPCGLGAGKDCYPWGAEGPVAGLWNYASKRNYLVSSVVSVLAISGTLFSTLIAPKGCRILVLVAGIAV